MVIFVKKHGYVCGFVETHGRASLQNEYKTRHVEQKKQKRHFQDINYATPYGVQYVHGIFICRGSHPCLCYVNPTDLGHAEAP